MRFSGILGPVCCLVLLLLGMSFTAGTSAEPVQQAIPGTAILFVPPAGFEKAERFTGFRDPKTGASIMISQIAGPYEALTAGFTEANLATRGITLISNQPLRIGGEPARLLKVTQVSQGHRFVKWILIFGSTTRTAILTAMWPPDREDTYATPLRQSLLQTAWADSKKTGASPVSTDSLPFALNNHPDLVLTGRIQQTLLYGISSDAVRTAGPGDVMFIAGPSIAEGLAIGDRKSYALKRAQQHPNLSNVRVEQTETPQIDGLPGFEFIGEAIHTPRNPSEKPSRQRFYQLMLFEPSAYYLFVGTVAGSVERQTRFVAAFRELSRSFRRNSSISSH